jgi:hypothetical protein
VPVSFPVFGSYFPLNSKDSLPFLVCFPLGTVKCTVPAPCAPPHLSVPITVLETIPGRTGRSLPWNIICLMYRASNPDLAGVWTAGCPGPPGA